MYLQEEAKSSFRSHEIWGEWHAGALENKPEAKLWSKLKGETLLFQRSGTQDLARHLDISQKRANRTSSSMKLHFLTF